MNTKSIWNQPKVNGETSPDEAILRGGEMKVKAWKCEKIPEKEFDKHPYLYDGWREDFRKNGFVYIIYDPKNKKNEKLQT